MGRGYNPNDSAEVRKRSSTWGGGGGDHTWISLPEAGSGMALYTNEFAETWTKTCSTTGFGVPPGDWGIQHGADQPFLKNVPVGTEDE